MAEERIEEGRDVRSHTHSNESRTPPRDEGEGLSELIRNQISAEVGKALENIMPTLLAHIEATIERVLDRRLGKPTDDERNEDDMTVIATEKAKQKGKGKEYCTYKGFMICKPKEYTGDIDPLASMRWIDSVEESFRTANVNPDDKVLFASNLLMDRAKDWLKIPRKDWLAQLLQTLLHLIREVISSGCTMWMKPGSQLLYIMV